MSGWRDVPAIVRRCVVAVYSKTTGGSPDGVIRAFKICRDKLARDGYLYPRGNDQILESIILTGKGFERDLHHVHAGPEGAAKDQTFARLFAMIEPQLYELDGRGGRQQPVNAPSADHITPSAETARVMDDPVVLGGIDGFYPPNNPPKK